MDDDKDRGETPSPPPEPGPEVVLRAASSRRLLPWLAALSSARVPYRVIRGVVDWEVHVAPDHAVAAHRELEAYQAANRDWPPVAAVVADWAGDGGARDTDIIASLAAAVALVMFFRVAGPVDSTLPLFQAGMADAARISADGEWWRAVTALTLHADLSHVLGNALCAFCFGLAIAHQLGFGVAWFLILLSGVLGNLVSARLVTAPHVALGASTATFGALGILVVFQCYRNMRLHGNLRSVWSRSWVPLAAGAAMLALLGVGPNADVSGHLCGFGSGLVLAVAALPLLRQRLSPVLQVLFFALTSATVWWAWRVALLSAP